MGYTYIATYGSGYLAPGYSGHNLGDAFKLNAEARYNKYQIDTNNGDKKKIYFTPTDEDLLDAIDSNSNIKRLDIYSHAWPGGINLGGFDTKRKYMRNETRTVEVIEIKHSWIDIFEWFPYEEKVTQTKTESVEKEIDGSTLDWLDQSTNTDWRRLENSDTLSSNVEDETAKINSGSFASGAEIYLWGCQAGGSDDSNAQNSFAQSLAKSIGNGCTVYAYIGSGGSMCVVDANGKNVYNGVMIPARVSYNKGNVGTSSIDPMQHFDTYPK